jgi:hypothetical protein
MEHGRDCTYAFWKVRWCMKQTCRVLLKDWILLVFVSCDTIAPHRLSTDQHHDWVLSLFPEVWQSASQHDDWVFPLFSEMQQKHMKQMSSIKSQRVLFPSPFRFSARLHSLFMHCLNQLANQPAYHATFSANCFLFLWKQTRAQKKLCACGFVIESNSVSFQIPDARVQMVFHECTRSELWFPPSGIRI